MCDISVSPLSFRTDKFKREENRAQRFITLLEDHFQRLHPGCLYRCTARQFGFHCYQRFTSINAAWKQFTDCRGADLSSTRTDAKICPKCFLALPTALVTDLHDVLGCPTQPISRDVPCMRPVTARSYRCVSPLIRDSSRKTQPRLSSVGLVWHMPSFTKLIQTVVACTGSSVFYNTPIKAFWILISVLSIPTLSECQEATSIVS